MKHDDLSTLSAFVMVAEERSFTKAAQRIGVSPSAVSHAIRGLEEGLGVRLLARTTRSVAPTDAGEQLLARLRPALGDVRAALDILTNLRERPAGKVRLVVSPMAAITVLAPKLRSFVRDYPEIVLDVTTDGGKVDLVAEGYDAGINLGEFIRQDMFAVRVSNPLRAAIVGAPGYFADNRKPATPRDLMQHRCINYRHDASEIYRWEFDKGDESLTVAVNGPLVLDDAEVVLRAALDGVGLAFLAEERVAAHLARGDLVRVLEDWCPPFPGFYLYHPNRRQVPAALKVLIDTLRM